MNLNHYEDFELKHKKKKQKKSPKKSNHKHDYITVESKVLFKFGIVNNLTKNYWLDVTKRCIICNKEKNESLHLTEEEFIEYKVNNKVIEK